MKPNEVTGGVTLENLGELRTIGLAHAALLKQCMQNDSPLWQVVIRHKQTFVHSDPLTDVMRDYPVHLDSAQGALAVQSLKFALLMPDTDVGLMLSAAEVIDSYRAQGGSVNVI